MLMLLFSVGGDRYALDCSQIVEAIPMVNLRKVHHTPNYVAGFFKYRGAIVSAIDLCQLIQGTASVPYLSTRIIILNCRQWISKVDPTRPENASFIIGLIAEQVTETLNISESDPIDPVMFSDRTSYLGETIADERGTIQLIRIEHFLGSSFNGLLPQREPTE